ncbi:MAG: hypothetical protein ACTSRS_00640 [Candidatus Helarchaeota archaeon]
MSKFFGTITFFLMTLVFVYFFQLPQVDSIAQNYLLTDPSFTAPQILAVLELVHLPLPYSFVIFGWLFAGFFAGLITRSWKGIISVALISGCILSLTWIIFMIKYTPVYWNTFLLTHTPLTFFTQTFGVALLLGGFSILPGIGGALITAPRKMLLEEHPLRAIETKCPTCGTIFQSNPKYCYKCNTALNGAQDAEGKEVEPQDI